MDAAHQSLQLNAARRQLQHEMYGTEEFGSGFVCSAHTPGYGQEFTLPLPRDVRELRALLSEGFGMQLASMRIRSRCAEGTGTPLEIWALLDSQDDLDAALEEANECGMHQLHLEVSGRSSKRSLDALSGVLDLVSSFAFLACALLLRGSAPAAGSADRAAQLALAGLIANGVVAAAVLCRERSPEFSAWARGGWPLLLLAPLSLEVLLLASSGACGLSAPLSARGRTILLAGGSLMLLLLRGAALALMPARAHPSAPACLATAAAPCWPPALIADAAAAPAFGRALAPLPAACAGLTAASAALSAALLLTQLGLGCCRLALPVTTASSLVPPAQTRPSPLPAAPASYTPLPKAEPKTALPEPQGGANGTSQGPKGAGKGSKAGSKPAAKGKAML